MSLISIKSKRGVSRFAILRAFFISFALVTSSISVSEGAGPTPVYSISRDLMQRSQQGYATVAEKMRRELKGRVPKKFMVDGIEYTGNYYKSGSFADVYKIVENGKTYALRIPRELDITHMARGLDTYEVAKNYAKLMTELNEKGIPSAKIISAPNAKTMVTKMEFLEGFQSVNDVLDHGSQFPKDPRVKRQIEALKEYAKKYGRLQIGDLHGDNIGFVPGKDGKFTVKIVDGMALSDNFTIHNDPSKSPLGEIFKNIEEFYAEEKLQIPKGVTEKEYRASLLRNLSELKTSVMAEAYPSAFGKGRVGPWVAPKVPITAATKKGLSLSSAPESVNCRIESGSQLQNGVKRTMGAAGDLMSVVSIPLAVLSPETNPYAEGQEIGVTCKSANAIKGRIKCEWDSPLNPFDQGVNCSRIKEVIPTGKSSVMLSSLSDEAVCRVVYDSFGFNVEAKGDREKLKAAGLFSSTGAKTDYNSTASFFKDLQKKVKLTETFIRENAKYPEPSLKDMEMI